jgi:mono/diheme cytochrome c family protein
MGLVSLALNVANSRRLRTVSGLLACVAVVAATATLAHAVDNALAEKGAQIYEDRCSACHGENLRNTSGGWSFDLRRLRPDEHDRFVQSVTNGKDNMPSWYGVLKPEDIDAIWAYIRATVDK